MMKMNAELKKVVQRLKNTQAQVQKVLSDKVWMDDARKFAEKQGKEVKKLIANDVTKVKTFLENERKGLERIQKQLPAEVKKIRKFVDQQKKELEKMLVSVRKSASTQTKKKKKPVAKKKKAASTTRKKAATRSAK